MSNQKPQEKYATKHGDNNIISRIQKTQEATTLGIFEKSLNYILDIGKIYINYISLKLF